MVDVVFSICRFDGYPCYRNLCCYSCSFGGRCSRFCKVKYGRVTPRIVKVDLQRVWK